MQAASISYLSEFHGDRNRLRWVTLAVMFMPLSVVYQPAIGLFIMPQTWQFDIFGIVFKTWRIFIMCNSSILAAAFVATMYMPESPKYLLAMGKQSEALDVLRMVFRVNSGNKKVRA